jgi:hypothetical protein
MRAITLAAGIAAGVLLAAGLGAYAQDTAKAAERVKTLEAEVALAKNPASYMVVDLGSKKISLKARGFVLKSWDIRRSRIWGKPVPVKDLKVAGRVALSKVQRKNITPGKEEPPAGGKPAAKSAGDPDVLELKDMPVHYALLFGDDIRLTVRPHTSRFWPAVVNVAKEVSWFAYLPLKTLWLSMKRRTFTEIEIVMPTETEAKSLYWAFLEGMGTIILAPSK